MLAGMLPVKASERAFEYSPYRSMSVREGGYLDHIVHARAGLGEDLGQVRKGLA